MKIKVRVIPNAPKSEIVKISPHTFKVKVKSPPTKGKANRELVELVAEYFKIKKSSVKITSGEKTKDKTILIE